MKLEGKISYYVTDRGIAFYFKKIDEKASKNSESDIFSYESVDIPFEIWSKFKGNKVKITVEKVK